MSRTAANIKIHAQAETFKQIVSAQSYMYILLGAVVFVAPQFSAALGGGASITKVTTALLVRGRRRCSAWCSRSRS